MKAHRSLALFVLFFGLMFSGQVLAQEGREEVPDPDEAAGKGGRDVVPALENSILREYFRKQVERMHSDPLPIRTKMPRLDEEFAERFIDRQIEHFLKNLEEKVASLSSSIGELEAMATQLTETSPDARGGNPLARRWRDQLRKSESAAEDLRRMLSFIFLGLNNRAEFKWDFEPDAESGGYQREILYLEEELAGAERLIRGYFFEPEHVISVQGLKEEDILIHLFRIREMTRQLRNRAR